MADRSTCACLSKGRMVLAVVGVAAAVAAASAGMAILGFAAPGAAIGGAIGAVVVLVLFAGREQRACPRCASELPQLRAPRSLRQALFGGWTCSNCGCEVDRSGRAV